MNNTELLKQIEEILEKEEFTNLQQSWYEINKWYNENYEEKDSILDDTDIQYLEQIVSKKSSYEQFLYNYKIKVSAMLTFFQSINSNLLSYYNLFLEYQNIYNLVYFERNINNWGNPNLLRRTTNELIIKIKGKYKVFKELSELLKLEEKYIKDLIYFLLTLEEMDTLQCSLIRLKGLLLNIDNNYTNQKITYTLS